jgi:hypothetical protein
VDWSGVEAEWLAVGHTAQCLLGSRASSGGEGQ